MRQIVLIVHDIRSCHNVGSLLRTAEGLGIEKVYLTGYTPYPAGQSPDLRMPHEVAKIDGRISKTALGSEKLIPWQAIESAPAVLHTLTEEGFDIIALEQTPHAVHLHEFDPPEKVALVVGNEVEGVERDLLRRIHTHVLIPMHGRKESFNVAQAAAMALYHLRFS